MLDWPRWSAAELLVAEALYAPMLMQLFIPRQCRSNSSLDVAVRRLASLKMRLFGAPIRRTLGEIVLLCRLAL